VASLSTDERKVIETRARAVADEPGGIFETAYAAEYLSSHIPNPWVAYAFASRTLDALARRHGRAVVAKNFFFILMEMKKSLQSWLERTSREVFKRMLAADTMRLMLVANNSYRLPQELSLPPTTPLLNRYHLPLQRSLFEYVPADSVNNLEKQVAYFLDDQEKLYFWYRNLAKSDYGLQAWRKERIYADFIFTVFRDRTQGAGKVYVLETKGEHLAGNKDTEYKRSVFDLCNELLKSAKPLAASAGIAAPDNIEYRLVMEDEWERELRSMFEDHNKLTR